jgi:hypothetical protein
VYLRADQKRWMDLQDMRPDEESFARMEEFLFWTAMLDR